MAGCFLTPTWPHALRAALLAALIAHPSLAAAQQVLISQGNTTALYDVPTSRVVWSLPVGIGLPDAVFTADGRYAIGVATDTFPVSVRVFDIAQGTAFGVPVSFEPRVAHPRVPRVFGLSGGPLSFGFMARGTLARLDLAGLTLLGGCAAGTTSDVTLSGNGRFLFARCDNGDITVLDAETSAVLRTLSFGQPMTFAASVDGSTLLMARPVVDGAIELVDSTSGAVLASTTPPDTRPCTPSIALVSNDRSVAVVSCWFPAGPLPAAFIFLLSVPSLAWGPTLPTGVNYGVASVSPDNRFAFSIARDSRNTRGQVFVLDVATGAIVQSVPLLASIAVSHPPLAPVASAVVTGRRVDLSWTLPQASPAVTRYLLEIGSATGLADLGTIDVGTQSALSVPSAPAGRFFVRVRAENTAGRSLASREILVDVP